MPDTGFPPEVIHKAIWLYLRFTLSLRDVEDLLAERGVEVSDSIYSRDSRLRARVERSWG